MKKLSIMMILTASFFFVTGCGDDDDDDEVCYTCTDDDGSEEVCGPTEAAADQATDDWLQNANGSASCIMIQ